MTLTDIHPAKIAAESIRNGPPDLIDVRTEVEYRARHIGFAVNVPLDRLDPMSIMKDRPADRPLYVICESGARGRKACERFHAAGFTNVVNVEGGTKGWEACDLPVVRGQAGMSLERQVRIGAGLLVLAGVALGWFVHPGFLGLSAFVGAGLTFAGLTDWCGMGMLLAKMPWNRVADATCKTGAST